MLLPFNISSLICCLMLLLSGQAVQLMCKTKSSKNYNQVNLVFRGFMEKAFVTFTSYPHQVSLKNSSRTPTEPPGQAELNSFGKYCYRFSKRQPPAPGFRCCQSSVITYLANQKETPGSLWLSCHQMQHGQFNNPLVGFPTDCNINVSFLGIYIFSCPMLRLTYSWWVLKGPLKSCSPTSEQVLQMDCKLTSADKCHVAIPPKSTQVSKRISSSPGLSMTRL